MLTPAIGAFIRPVGWAPYGYCLQVRSTHDMGGLRVQGKRWGMEHKTPVNDGYVCHGIAIGPLRAVRPGVWRDASGRDALFCPPYWVAMSNGPLGQMELLT
jgi:hypothetical protein